jgi:hypothetical protein
MRAPTIDRNSVVFAIARLLVPVKEQSRCQFTDWMFLDDVSVREKPICGLFVVSGSAWDESQILSYGIWIYSFVYE